MGFRLRSLTIHRFREARPETTLRFNDGWNVLLGQNATGKTSLLNLISMALRGDFAELSAEPFSVSYELAGRGNDLVRVELTHTPPPRVGAPGLNVSGFEIGGGAQTHGVIESRIGGETTRLTIPDDIGPNVPGLHRELRPNLAGAHIAEAMARWRSRGVYANCYRFDEALGMFHNIHGLTDDAVGLPGTVTPIAYLTPQELIVFAGFTPEGGVYSVAPSRDTPQSIDWDLSSCRHLRRATEALGAHRIAASWGVEDVSPGAQSRTLTLRSPAFLLQRSDGSAISSRLLSFGQKRLFAFAWYLDANDGPVVADELVNGMHYAWIEDCVHAMEGRQVFLTAQNPLLLDHIGVASSDEAKSRFILCRNEIDEDGRRRWVWSNPGEAQSAAFFEAYENGILQVHEILRAEGLW